MNDTFENISDSLETDPDWENRRLCSDESCIGVIGNDGRCRVCGLPDIKVTGGSDLSNGSNFQEINQETASEEQAPEAEEPGWDERKLCRDESCIGTIGTDGRCTVCGLPG